MAVGIIRNRWAYGIRGNDMLTEKEIVKNMLKVFGEPHTDKDVDDYIENTRDLPKPVLHIKALYGVSKE